MDPGIVDELKVVFNFDPLEFRARPRNLTFHRFSELKIKSATTDLRDDSFNFRLDLYLPQLVIFLKYTAQGKYEDLILKSRGKAIITCSK